MNDILLADSDSHTLEKMFEEIKIIFPCYELQTALEKKIQRRFY